MKAVIALLFAGAACVHARPGGNAGYGAGGHGNKNIDVVLPSIPKFYAPKFGGFKLPKPHFPAVNFGFPNFNLYVPEFQEPNIDVNIPDFDVDFTLPDIGNLDGDFNIFKYNKHKAKQAGNGKVTLDSIKQTAQLWPSGGGIGGGFGGGFGGGSFSGGKSTGANNAVSTSYSSSSFTDCSQGINCGGGQPCQDGTDNPCSRADTSAAAAASTGDDAAAAAASTSTAQAHAH